MGYELFRVLVHPLSRIHEHQLDERCVQYVVRYCKMVRLSQMRARRILLKFIYCIV